MKFLIIAMAGIGALTPAASNAGKPDAASPHVSKAALIAAARHAKLDAIDYGEHHCDSDVTVETWLKSLVGPQARAIAWTGGDCQLVNDMRPGIDASSWPWCAQATVSLVHPKARDDQPMIEIYLEKPVHGRPGAAYAFRGLMMTRDDGGDYERFRLDFQAEWRERFAPKSDGEGCTDEQR